MERARSVAPPTCERDENQTSLRALDQVNPDPAEHSEDRMGTTLMPLRAIWNARDEASMLLQRAHDDANALESAERTVRVLTADLARSAHHYSLVHGTKTQEGRTALINLGAATEDLRWVTAQRQTMIDTDLRDKLQHALRSSVNGLALLRWSMV